MQIVSDEMMKESLANNCACAIFQWKTYICLMFLAPLASRCYSHGKVETDEEFDARWVTYFSKPDIDAWELRKGDCVDTKWTSYSIVSLSFT